MAFEPADRAALDEILANTASIASILQIASGIRNAQAGQASLSVQLETLGQTASLLSGQKLQATASGQITQNSFLAQILILLEQILALVKPNKPVRLGLGFPLFTLKTTGEKLMATLAMLDIEVAHIPIMTLNAEGNVVPAPSGDVFSVASADITQVAAVIGVDASSNPEIVVTPLVQTNSAGVMITLTDSSGLTAFEFTVTVSRDTKPASDFANLAGVTFTSQSEPSAPGPG